MVHCCKELEPEITTNFLFVDSPLISFELIDYPSYNVFINFLYKVQ